MSIMSKSLIFTNIKCYRTYSIYLLSRLYAILLSITKKTARKWKFGNVKINGNLATCMMFRAPPTSASLFWFYYSRIIQDIWLLCSHLIFININVYLLILIFIY